MIIYFCSGSNLLPWPIGSAWNVFMDKMNLCRRNIMVLFYGSVDARLCLRGDNVVSMFMEANSFRYGDEYYGSVVVRLRLRDETLIFILLLI